MFLDQRRSVGGPRLSRNVFWIKVGQLGPRVCHVTFLDQRRSVGAPRLSRNQPGTMRNQPFWLVSIVPWFLVGFHSFFKVVSWFFMVFGWFPWFFKVVSSWFFRVPGR